MFNTHSGSHGHSSSGGHRRSANNSNRRRRPSGQRFSGNNGNRRGGQRRGRFEGAKISHDKYIAKAVEIAPEQVYISEHKFSELPIHETIKANIAKKGYTSPTKIQDQTIKHILDGKDVLGIASTGSGKTAAFLIPLINKVMKDRSERVLVMVPTRELATQIENELRVLSFGTHIRFSLVIGGANMYRQISSLKANPQFVIGTPGRLKDLLNQKALKLEEFNNIVLDEVDRMLDMGFVHDIKFLISKMRNEKQSLFFSATMSREAETIANSLSNDAVKIETEVQSTAKSVDQNIVKVGSRDKLEVLEELLRKEEFKKVLIFARTKHGSDKISKKLFSKGFKVDVIHGNKTQNRRDKVIQMFRNEQIKILVATDVAARGLDIKDVTHVINFDEPANYEDYIHRIGRTGRSGKKGIALTFVH